jgi:putative nucleotidyltransferase with HDIG domain
MTNAKLDKIVSEVNAFPSMPVAVTKLLALLEDPEADVDEIEKVLRYEPGLTANVLKLANSAYFGIPAKVGSVRQAVLLLGLKKLMQLVIASCVSAVLDNAIAGYELPLGGLWKHSIAVSIAAETLAKDRKEMAGEDIFTAALLHDVGKLILGKYVKEDLEAIQCIASKGVPFVMAENMILGTDHSEIGAQILKRWSFPPEVVEVVRWHHDPESVDEPNLKSDIVYLANLLCHSKKDDAGYEDQIFKPSAGVIERLGIEMDQFMVVAEKVAQWVDELSETLKFR